MKKQPPRRTASADLPSVDASGIDRPSWSPWRTVIGFGVVSLAADMVYEGARSVTGPLLASLGASAVLVGLVSGAGEATALLMRLVFGSWADRSGRYWSLTFVGYGLTAVCVPALAITPFFAGAGLALACVLILGERLGKAVRSPAKTALLARAAAAIGLGRGFGVHQALDQIGAVAGPLLVAAVAAAAGTLWPAMAVLIIPGAVAMLLLIRIWRSMGNPITGDRNKEQPTEPAAAEEGRESLLSRLHGRLPRVFWLFAAASAAASGGLVTFAVISFHLTQDHVLPVAAVPLIYAAAMAAEAFAALGSGWLSIAPEAAYSLACRSWCLLCRFWRSPVRRWLPLPVRCSGARREAYLIPPSRRSLPTWFRSPGAPPGTACLPLCRVPQPLGEG